MIVRSISSAPRRSRAQGMTLLELTVVIFVLMGLISILFVAAQAWKRGADRGMCVMNIQVTQKALRSFSNLYGYNPGDSVTGLKDKIFSPGGFIEVMPVCKGGGEYFFGGASGEDAIPQVGHLYLECSYSESRGHSLPPNGEW
ncbi:type II secretion system protein [Luteolibacter sp. SL250]|uniref:type II secretion system protein n=1 Tax=Luteolibacter sp. SL250 TaxID=2995170 RepID=UPI0022717198|nr:type II secretion system protein [Luteolibacter sp. SL250]WAC19330.1 type II secretion system protein [Luteolibacter sp. SL250]